MSANDLFNDEYISSIISSYIPPQHTIKYRNKYYTTFDDVRSINILWKSIRINKIYNLGDDPLMDNPIDKKYRHDIYEQGARPLIKHSNNCVDCLACDPYEYEYFKKHGIVLQYILWKITLFVISATLTVTNWVCFPVLYPIFLCALNNRNKYVHDHEDGFGYNSDQFPFIYNYPEFTRQILCKYLSGKVYVRSNSLI